MWKEKEGGGGGGERGWPPLIFFEQESTRKTVSNTLFLPRHWRWIIGVGVENCGGFIWFFHVNEIFVVKERKVPFFYDFFEIGLLFMFCLCFALFF